MNAPFGHYLRIKPQDNMLSFLLVKANKTSLVQLRYYSIKYSIDQFWTFYENITPWKIRNISKLAVNFKSC